MLELGILAYIVFAIATMVWALSDLPRYFREKKKRGKRDDYWRF